MGISVSILPSVLRRLRLRSSTAWGTLGVSSCGLTRRKPLPPAPFLALRRLVTLETDDSSRCVSFHSTPAGALPDGGAAARGGGQLARHACARVLPGCARTHGNSATPGSPRYQPPLLCLRRRIPNHYASTHAPAGFAGWLMALYPFPSTQAGATGVAREELRWQAEHSPYYFPKHRKHLVESYGGEEEGDGGGDCGAAGGKGGSSSPPDEKAFMSRFVFGLRTVSEETNEGSAAWSRTNSLVAAPSASAESESLTRTASAGAPAGGSN